MPEIVTHGETGILCPVDDVNAYVEGLRALVCNPEVRHRMGEAARERALERWRWDKVAARVERDVYAPLLQAYS